MFTISFKRLAYLKWKIFSVRIYAVFLCFVIRCLSVCCAIEVKMWRKMMLLSCLISIELPCNLTWFIVCSDASRNAICVKLQRVKNEIVRQEL